MNWIKLKEGTYLPPHQELAQGVLGDRKFRFCVGIPPLAFFLHFPDEGNIVDIATGKRGAGEAWLLKTDEVLNSGLDAAEIVWNEDQKNEND